MSLNAIKSITEAEETAKNTKLEAQAKVKQSAELAQQEGHDAIVAALEQAENEVRHLKRESELKAEEFAKNLASVTANKRAALRAQAESKLEIAAQLIVERIVSG